MRIFLLGGHPHKKEFLEFLMSLISLPRFHIKTKALYFYIYIYIYIHSEAWFARDTIIHTLAMIYTLAMIHTLAIIHTLAHM
jgi:hypothetical protein